MSDGKVPEWLRARWVRTKSETAARVQAAVDQLRERGRGVTFESIRETIRSMHGVSISANTIKRNEQRTCLSDLFGSSAETKSGVPAATGPPSAVANASGEERRGLQARISRLRGEPKDSLVAKLVCLERAVTKQRDVENRLRESV